MAQRQIHAMQEFPRIPGVADADVASFASLVMSDA
jgi:hypothetical protein